jgi:DNA polymerase-1
LIAIDTETTGLGYYDTAFCATTYSRETGASWFELPRDDNDLYDTIMASSEWVFHNPKFDLHKLLNQQIITRRILDSRTIHDTEALAFLLDEQRPKGLKPLAKSVLGLETDEASVLQAEFRKRKLKKKDGFHQLPMEVLKPYALKDAEYTYLLFENLYPQVAAVDSLHKVYEFERKLSLVLLDIERRGIGIDTEYVDKATRSKAGEQLMLELSLRDMAGSEAFLPGSWQQILAVLSERGIDAPDTKEETLASLDDQFARTILEYRHTKKINDYLKAIQYEQRDGVLHPWFNQHQAKTGRMSSSGAKE